jgi:transcriptional regulator with XRE-family HTH domain
LSSILRSEIPDKTNTFPMEIREVFARNLRRRRHAKGLSQEALAHEADVDRTYISSLERGVYAATIDMVGKLADVLGVEPDELLRRSVRSPRTKP